MGEDNGDNGGEFIPLGQDEKDFDDTRDFYPEDISLAADTDAMQGHTRPRTQQKNPEPKCLTRVVQTSRQSHPRNSFSGSHRQCEQESEAPELNHLLPILWLSCKCYGSDGGLS